MGFGYMDFIGMLDGGLGSGVMDSVDGLSEGGMGDGLSGGFKGLLGGGSGGAYGEGAGSRMDAMTTAPQPGPQSSYRREGPFSTPQFGERQLQAAGFGDRNFSMDMSGGLRKDRASQIMGENKPSFAMPDIGQKGGFQTSVGGFEGMKDAAGNYFPTGGGGNLPDGGMAGPDYRKMLGMAGGLLGNGQNGKGQQSQVPNAAAGELPMMGGKPRVQVQQPQMAGMGMQGMQRQQGIPQGPRGLLSFR